MSLKSKPVNLPDKKNLKILKNGYVYFFTKSNWDNSLKMPKDDRVCIGKLSEDSTKLIPNKKYFEIFQVKEIEEPDKLDTQLSVGSYLAFRRASEYFGLYDCLKKNFPKIYEKIFAYALYMAESNDSKGQHYEKRAFKNFSGLDSSLTSSQISELYSSIDEDSINDFFKDYQKTYKKLNKLDERLSVAFDSTNQNTNATDITLAEYGHAKKDKTIPIINNAYLVDEVTGIPLYYETFYGSLLDKIETEYSLEKFSSVGFKDVLYIMDRGYFSKKNKELMQGEKYTFLMPDTFEFVKKVIQNYGKDIKDRSTCYLDNEKCYGAKISVGDEILEKFKDFKDTNLYLFYDGIRAQETRNNIVEYANNLKKHVENNYKYYNEKLAESYSSFLTIIKTSFKSKRSKFKCLINHEKIQESLDKSGFFIAVSNVDLSPEKMISAIRKRDSVEKTFKRMKSGLMLDTPFVHKDETYIGKMFLCFIALNLIETYRYLIKKYLNSVSSITTFTAIAELSKIIFYREGKKFRQKYALTKKQKEQFSLLGIKCDNLVKTLEKYQS